MSIKRSMVLCVSTAYCSWALVISRKLSKPAVAYVHNARRKTINNNKKREIGRYRDMERCGKMEEQREMGRDRGQR